MENTAAVVMFCGPHYDGQVHFGRIDRAIQVALRYNCTLIVAGDGNHNQDVKLFARRANRAGVRQVLQAKNGRNTRGDAISAIKAIVGDDRISQLVIVSDWYHMARCTIALYQEAARQLPERTFRISQVPVWQHFFDVLSILPNELCGIRDYLKHNPQTSRGLPFFKPAIEKET
ncbi:YdcF family protein [Patescibacteria group bacterium]